MSITMIKLKRGFAPGLLAGRPDADGRKRYRWMPGPSQRQRGFKSLYLRGAPGVGLTTGDWLGLGFATEGCSGLTLNGPPLDLESAAAACRAIAKTAGSQASALPTHARPIAAAHTLNAAFDHFLDQARSGRVKRRGKDGRKQSISAKTIQGYQHALQCVRELAGDMPARDLARSELVSHYETYIDRGMHPSAVASQRAVSRALNWLREDPSWRAHLPRQEVYSRLGLGQPKGRLRMASPEEAEAMFEALNHPAALGRELDLHRDDLPMARPAAAAAWLMALWTVQRAADTLAFTETATAGKRLLWRQGKTGRKVNIPLEAPALEARRLALASRGGCDHRGMLFMDTELARPYLMTSKKTGVTRFRRFNTHWTEARELAGRKIPSLLGGTRDPFGDEIPALCFSDARDTGVTRLFEAMQQQDGALASVSAWHGSDVETLIKLFRHYLVLNPRFANAAGDALRKHARTMGFAI
jgi:hypothetical protein